jgi:hypothetical protein
LLALKKYGLAIDITNTTTAIKARRGISRVAMMRRQMAALPPVRSADSWTAFISRAPQHPSPV